MALLFRKSTFYRTAILLGVGVSFAAQMPDASHFLSASAAQLPSQQMSQKGTSGEKSISQRVSERQAQINADEPGQQSQLSGKQQRKLLKSNFERMKKDAGELTDLAKALQDEVNKSNENVLSLDIVDKADKIEKLARRIKGNARGF